MYLRERGRATGFSFMVYFCIMNGHRERIEVDMSEKRLNNTIFLMYLVTQNYCREHNISTEDFLKLDEKYAILNYVAECPDIFDSLTGSEMVREMEQYVAQP